MYCKTCKAGAINEVIVSEYNAAILGAPFTVSLVDSVKQKICCECDEILSTSIPDLDALLHFVAAERASLKQKLSADEIRFIRNAIGMKGKEVASQIEMTPENYSRVENGKKVFSPQSEKLFRVMVIVKLFDDESVKPSAISKIAKTVDLKITPVFDVNDEIRMRLVHCASSADDLNKAPQGHWSERIAA